jgi:hypothetical protein
MTQTCPPRAREPPRSPPRTGDPRSRIGARITAMMRITSTMRITAMVRITSTMRITAMVRITSTMRITAMVRITSRSCGLPIKA